MNKIVPLISSALAGPLGVVHLPRFWLKVSLECRGKLAPGYQGCGKGYDQMVLDGLGLKREAVSLTSRTTAPLIHSLKAGSPSSPAPNWTSSPLTSSTAPSAVTSTTTRAQGDPLANGIADDPASGRSQFEQPGRLEGIPPSRIEIGQPSILQKAVRRQQ